MIAMQMLGDARGNRPGYDAGKIFGAGEAHAGDASEFAKQLLHGARTHARDLVEFSLQRSARTALAVETDGEAVRLVPDLLDQMQQRRMPFQAYRFIFLAENEKDLFLFGDRRDGLVDDLQFFQRLRRGVKL